MQQGFPPALPAVFKMPLWARVLTLAFYGAILGGLIYSYFVKPTWLNYLSPDTPLPESICKAIIIGLVALYIYLFRQMMAKASACYLDISTDGIEWYDFPIIQWKELASVEMVPPKYSPAIAQRSRSLAMFDYQAYRQNEFMVSMSKENIGLILYDLESYKQRLNEKQLARITGSIDMYNTPFPISENIIKMPANTFISWMEGLRQQYGANKQ